VHGEQGQGRQLGRCSPADNHTVLSGRLKRENLNLFSNKTRGGRYGEILFKGLSA